MQNNYTSSNTPRIIRASFQRSMLASILYLQSKYTLHTTLLVLELWILVSKFHCVCTMHNTIVSRLSPLYEFTAHEFKLLPILYNSDVGFI